MISSIFNISDFNSIPSIEEKVNAIAAYLYKMGMDIACDTEASIAIQYRDDSVKRLEVNEKGNWIDLYASEDYILKQGEHKLVDLGVAMKIPDGYEAYILPRSSTFKKWHVIQANHMGVVDTSYCGPNDWWKMSVIALVDTVINKGDKICQFRIMKSQPNIHFTETELTGKDRGGFGSTGSV